MKENYQGGLWHWSKHQFSASSQRCQSTLRRNGLGGCPVDVSNIFSISMQLMSSVETTWVSRGGCAEARASTRSRLHDAWSHRVGLRCQDPSGWIDPQAKGPEAKCFVFLLRPKKQAPVFPHPVRTTKGVLQPVDEDDFNGISLLGTPECVLECDVDRSRGRDQRNTWSHPRVWPMIGWDP